MSERKYPCGSCRDLTLEPGLCVCAVCGKPLCKTCNQAEHGCFKIFINRKMHLSVRTVRGLMLIMRVDTTPVLCATTSKLLCGDYVPTWTLFTGHERQQMMEFGWREVEKYWAIDLL